ncbi:MAG: SDR family oxidoreductase [Bacillota bacterium]
MNKKKILILGVAGMLGHALFVYLSKLDNLDVYGTARNITGLSGLFGSELMKKIQDNVNAHNFDSIVHMIAETKPDLVINCIGMIKQVPAARDNIETISMNALLPHRIARICGISGSRLLQISTDCVFDGVTGSYHESDTPNPTDLYGRTKLLGELNDAHCLTLRTSIIGHELKDKHGLIEWFLGQQSRVRGFTNAIYSGFPTVEIAWIIGKYVIPNPKLTGLYHLSADAISKYDLLRLVAVQYNKQIEIEPCNDFHLDRSLDSTLFRQVTGYSSPPWPELVSKMYQDYMTAPHYQKTSYWKRNKEVAI